MASYVLIWQDNLVKERRVKEAKWIGHAAMNIGARFSLGAQPGPSNYVSWWPSKAAKFTWFGLLMSYARLASPDGVAQPSLPADVESEDYLPDHVIEVPSDADQERRMADSWSSFVSTHRGRYNSIWENCSTMVAETLGEVGLLTSKRKVWTPTILHQAVSAISGSNRMQWAAMIPIIEKDKDVIVKDHIIINFARSGAYCTTGVPVRYQPNQQWQPKQIEKTK